MVNIRCTKNDIPYKSEVVSLAGGDHTFTITCHAVRCNADGVVYLRYAGDSEARAHTVKARDYVIGHITQVRLAGTTVADTSLLGLAFPLE